MHNSMRRTRPGSLVVYEAFVFGTSNVFSSPVSMFRIRVVGPSSWLDRGTTLWLECLSSRCHRCHGHVMPSMSMQSTASRFCSRSLKGLPRAKISLYQQTWKPSNETLVHCWSQLKSASSWRSNQSSRWFRPHAHTHHDCFTGGHDSLQSHLLSSSVKMCLQIMISLC